MRNSCRYLYESDYQGGAIRVDLKTGEVTDEAVVLYGEPGSILLSPAQQKARRRYAEKKTVELERQIVQLEANHAEKLLRAESGAHFIFHVLNNDLWSGISPENITRSLVLGTYIGYNANELFKTERTNMQLSDIQEILQISKSTRIRFWNEVKGRLFDADSSGRIIVKNQVFARGILSAHRDSEYQKIYIQALRELYLKTPISQHNKLGYVFQILHFLNFEYNILCRNPNETDYKLIDPITVGDFCEIIGYDRSNAARLMHEFNRITFQVGDCQERFCKFLGDGRSDADSHIFVNPRIVYKGHDFRKVEAVCISFLASATQM